MKSNFLSVVVQRSGQLSRSADGLAPYVMIRDSGPRRFGAVAYVGRRTVGRPSGFPPMRHTYPGELIWISDQSAIS